MSPRLVLHILLAVLDWTPSFVCGAFLCLLSFRETGFNQHTL